MRYFRQQELCEHRAMGCARFRVKRILHSPVIFGRQCAESGIGSSPGSLGETIQETLTLLSYRLSKLNWAINPSDHGARKNPLAARNLPIQEIDVPRPGA
jgi:hypothetical protein